MFVDIESTWSIVEHRRKQKVLLVFGIKASTSLVEFKSVSDDIRLNWVIARACFRKFETHMKICVNSKFDKYYTCEYVSRLYKFMHVA